MAKAQTRSEYVRAWKAHAWEINKVATSGDDLELAIEIQTQIQALCINIEKMADILVSNAEIKPDPV